MLNWKPGILFHDEKIDFIARLSCSLRLLLFALTIALLTAPPLPALAKDTPANDKATKDVSNFRIKIRRLQQGISRQKSQLLESVEKERNILAELEVLDKKLLEHQQKLDDLESKMAKQKGRIDREEKALKKIRSEKSIVQNHLQKRISAYYTMGDIGLLNVTFSTKTLPEMLFFHDSFDNLIKYDQHVIRVYQETIKELERVKTTLDLKKVVLENFIDLTLQEKKAVQDTMVDKERLLTHIRTQSKLHQQAVKEMEQASVDLADSIVAIKSKKQVYEQSFVSNKGSLPPPVDGTIITLFQQEKTNKLGISRKSMGIELEAVDGTKIIAVSDGQVIFSGYLRGYGNTVIIHHGMQYYTVTSRIEKLIAQKGQKIRREDTIGLVGDTATLFDEGLYFEIRHGRKSLDPLLWLNPNRLASPLESDSNPVTDTLSAPKT